MSVDFLSTIAREKLDFIGTKESYYQNLKKNLSTVKHTYYGIFKKAVSRQGKINLIAEVKKASPSVGLIREDFNAVNIAKTYASNGADALSVLTEEKYFLGRLGYLKAVTDEVPLPALMKDFIAHEYQIYESVMYGASAILLIVAMLSDQQIRDYMQVANTLGLDVLVEVHDENELERAIKNGADIIGVNNRDLHTLEVNINNCLRMIPYIPKDKVIVAESGLKTADDIHRVYQAGANAVLIGETFMRANDIGLKVRELMGRS